MYFFVCEKSKTTDDERRKEAEASLERAWEGCLGNRLRSIGVGSAPVTPAVTQWMKRVFRNAVVGEGYGSTEVGTITSDNKIAAEALVRLEPIDALGMLGEAHEPPTGEVVVKTPHLCSGYFGEEKATADAFTSDGYFRTGDIGRRLGDELVLLGRVKHGVKLENGEFVQPERIETTIGEADCVREALVHCDPGALRPVAIVLAAKSVLANLARTLGAEGDSDEEVCDSVEAQRACLDAIQSICQNRGLAPYEIPSAVHITLQDWTPENGLLTSSNKPSRRHIEAFYAEPIRRMLIAPTAQTATESAVKAAQDAGGDSLETARLALQLRREHGLDVSVQTLLQSDPSSSVAAFRQDVTALKKEDFLEEVDKDFLEEVDKDFLEEVDKDFLEEVDKDFVEEAHKKDFEEVAHKKDIVEEVAHKKDIVEEVAHKKDFEEEVAHKIDFVEVAEKVRNAKVVFVTGATGFLGVHLVAHIVEVLSDCLIRCLVRPSKSASAEDRFASVVEDAGYDWGEIGRRVEVVSGDLEKSGWGLDGEQWSKSVEGVDVVFHVGAIVNWVRSYESLRKANIIGTQIAVQFANSARAPMVYVSTASTTSGSDGRELTVEEILERLEAGEGGYVATKWLGERIARKSHAGCAIVRPGMITGHSKTGHAHPGQFTARYLAACAQLGVAATDGGSKGSKDPRLELCPVDWVAQAIVGGASVSLSYRPDHSLILTNAEHSPTLASIAKDLYLAGFQVRPVPYDTFYSTLRSSDHNALTPLESFFHPTAFPAADPTPLRHTPTIDILTAAHIPLAPKLDRGLVARYLSALVLRGHVPGAQKQPPSTSKIPTSEKPTSSKKPKKSPALLRMASSPSSPSLPKSSVPFGRAVSAPSRPASSRASAPSAAPLPSLEPNGGAWYGGAASKTFRYQIPADERARRNAMLLQSISETLRRDPEADLTETLRNYLKI